MYLHKTKNGHYTPPCCYFSGELEVVELRQPYPALRHMEIYEEMELTPEMVKSIYCEALRHIVEAWEGRPDSFRAAVLRGVMYFVQLYHGQYSAERLVRALSGVHPMELYRISRDNPARLPGWRRYVYPIYTTYNGKCRKDALPMKF